MRDELVVIATARLLRQTGMHWTPQVGDWCSLLDGLHTSNAHGGLWLVVDVDSESRWIAVIDAAAQWSPARIARRDALWLPTIGQLKGWLRGAGYIITTSEGTPPLAQQSATEKAPVPQGWAAAILGATQPASLLPQHPIFAHHCTVTRTTAPLTSMTGVGPNEAEATADALFNVLMSDERRQQHQSW